MFSIEQHEISSKEVYKYLRIGIDLKLSFPKKIIIPKSEEIAWNEEKEMHRRNNDSIIWEQSGKGRWTLNLISNVETCF